MERIRLTFEKKGAMCYTSHLDLQKVWMRAMLRAKLPVAYTQGFHPTPKVGYSWPLPLGWSTSGELIDIWLDGSDNRQIKTSGLIEDLNQAMPPGLRVLCAQKIQLFSDSLTTAIVSADYLVTFPAGTELHDLNERAAALMMRETIERDRRGKTYDMRPLIEDFSVKMFENVPAVYVRMAARDSAMGRPDELVSEMGYDPLDLSFERLKYYLKK